MRLIFSVVKVAIIGRPLPVTLSEDTDNTSKSVNFKVSFEVSESLYRKFEYVVGRGNVSRRIEKFMMTVVEEYEEYGRSNMNDMWWTFSIVGVSIIGRPLPVTLSEDIDNTSKSVNFKVSFEVSESLYRKFEYVVGRGNVSRRIEKFMMTVVEEYEEYGRSKGKLGKLRSL
jgi:phage gpG-like protein